MDEEMKDLLAEEIKDEIRSLSVLEPGSVEKSKAIDDLVKLYRLRIEETKNQLDLDVRYETMEREDDVKKNQLVNQIKDRYFKLGIEAAGIILPMLFYARWMKKGLSFEETGTFTSMTFKGLINRFRPTK